MSRPSTTSRSRGERLAMRYASRIGETCRKGGLLISAEDDVLMLFPALTSTRETAERGLDIFEKSI